MRKLSQIIYTAVIAAAFAVAFVPRPADAQAAGEHQHGQAVQAQQGCCAGMKDMMDGMAATKKANTGRLNALMAQMKTAVGDARVAAMSEVISILLEERAGMQQHCAAMRANMHK
jgi:hypothetical protein